MFLVDDSVFSGRRPIILDNRESVKTFLSNLEIEARQPEEMPRLYLINEIEIDVFFSVDKLPWRL